MLMRYERESNMRQERENLDILFRRITPELVLENIRQYWTCEKENLFRIDAYSYCPQIYDHYAVMNLPEYSIDEMELCYEESVKITDSLPNAGIFSAIIKYADKVLGYKAGRPVCKLDEILNWNSVTSRLGQDIFVTAWMAWHDLETGSRHGREKLTWPAILPADDPKLNEIIERGLAENHFHFHGSTQNFSLSWACLMNHPQYVNKFIKEEGNFQENLSHGISRGVADNVLGWDSRLLYAAMIRGLLFERCLGIISSEKVGSVFRDFMQMPLSTYVRQVTEVLRIGYGSRFSQMNGRDKCLDYANCKYFYQVDEGEHNRLLAGERCFLYQCFAMQFRGDLSFTESALFYCYLLLKSNFRSELIQINKRYGFTNFQRYQDRKNQFYSAFMEYWTEAQRLSVCAGAEDSHICSLESRIMPKDSALKMKREIDKLDRMVHFSYNRSLESFEEKRTSMIHFYVIHFAKAKFKKDELNRHIGETPRNWKVRKKIRIQSLALHNYLKKYDISRQRVWGIDACSLEIGCRPETFATEFRYLRNSLTGYDGSYWYKSEKNLHEPPGITYHVGEDFLDITDGLRAIDEAQQFLELGKGDRIGHGLVLGIEPEDFYQLKRNIIYLTKQDYLDNIVWILFRSLELKVSIDTDIRAKLTNSAIRLLNEIYGDAFEDKAPGGMLDLYYQSWKLRGDHPSLYSEVTYKSFGECECSRYEHYMESKAADAAYRDNQAVSYLYYLYHFSDKVKMKGLSSKSIEVEQWYIDLVKRMQAAMRSEIFKKGIMIECNPSSNVLIGTFRSYDRHPILKFNDHNLADTPFPKLQVSINTDDLGVFDTSLSNEYALMFCAIARMRHRNQEYNDEKIYEYLEYIRKNGINMSFRKIDFNTYRNY